MPSLYEGPFPRPVTKDTAEIVYLIKDADTELDARNFLLTQINAIYDNKPYDDYNIDPMPLSGWYRATVFYKYKPGGPADANESGGVSGLRFSMMGGTRILQTSLETRAKYPSVAGTAVDFSNALNVDGETEAIGGVEVANSEFIFEKNRRFAPGELTDEIVAGWVALKDHVNDKPYKGFQKGEVIFKGAEGAQTAVESDVTFYFRARPNSARLPAANGSSAGSLTVAGIPNVVFEGWDHVWVLYRNESKARADGKFQLTPVAKQVNVERIYHYGDLTILPV